jgi:hypothetical protein
MRECWIRDDVDGEHFLVMTKEELRAARRPDRLDPSLRRDLPSCFGPAVVLVASGELTFYDADDGPCTGRSFAAGQALIDHGQDHMHFAANQA